MARSLSVGPNISLALKQRNSGVIVPAVSNGVLTANATFTRDDTAKYFDSNGVMQEAAKNEARTTYIDGNPYLWIDGEVTEDSGHSHDITTWSDGPSTATTAQNAVGPDGASNTATTVTDGSNTVLQQIADDVTIADGTEDHYQWFRIPAEDAPTSYARYSLQLFGGTILTHRVVFDPSDGSVVELGNDGEIVIKVKIGDFWHLLIKITNNNTGNVTKRRSIEPAYNSDASASANAATQGSRVIAVADSYETNFSLHPILTTGGTTATVAADVASLTNSIISSLTEGVVYMEIWSPQLTSDAARHIAELESDANNFIRVQHATDGDLDAQITTGGVSQATLSGTDLTVGTLEKVALAFDGSDYALYRDGTQEATAASGTMPSVDTLLIGAGLFGGIKTLNVYPTRLSNSQLASLTT